MAHHLGRRARCLLAVRRFGAAYGWRAYALPVLSLLTIAVLLQHSPSSGRADASGPGPNRSTVAPSAGATAPQSHPVPARVPTVIQQLDGLDETDSSRCATNTQPKLVLVSIGAQRVWACERARQVYTTLATTGAENVGNGTPIGSWVVQAKQTDRYLVGPGYRDFVHYWMPFDGDFGFHDATWQTMPFGSAGYQANGSHGCVHLPMSAMTWLFRWAEIGTTVTIQA